MEDFNQGRQPDLFGIEVDNQIKQTFMEMAKWTQFLAVLGFVFLGLMVLAGFGMAFAFKSMGNMTGMGSLGAFSGVALMFVYLIIAGIYFYPTYALYKYSSGIKVAMRTNNKHLFNQSVGYLKSFFKFFGIIMVIVLGIYAVGILVVMLVGSH